MTDLDKEIGELNSQSKYSEKGIERFVAFATKCVEEDPSGTRAAEIHDWLISRPLIGAQEAIIDYGPHIERWKNYIKGRGGDNSPLPLTHREEDFDDFEKGAEQSLEDNAEKILSGKGKVGERFAWSAKSLNVTKGNYLTLGVSTEEKKRLADAKEYVNKMRMRLQECNDEPDLAQAKWVLDHELARIGLQKGLGHVVGVLDKMVPVPALIPLALNVGAVLSSRWHLQNLALIREFARSEWKAEASADFSEAMQILDYVMHKKSAKMAKRLVTNVPVISLLQKAVFSFKGLYKEYKETRGKARELASKRLVALAKGATGSEIGGTVPSRTLSQLIIAELMECRIEDAHMHDSAKRYCCAVYSEEGWKFIMNKMASM